MKDGPEDARHKRRESDGNFGDSTNNSALKTILDDSRDGILTTNTDRTTKKHPLCCLSEICVQFCIKTDNNICHTNITYVKEKTKEHRCTALVSSDKPGQLPRRNYLANQMRHRETYLTALTNARNAGGGSQRSFMGMPKRQREHSIPSRDRSGQFSLLITRSIIISIEPSGLSLRASWSSCGSFSGR